LANRHFWRNIATGREEWRWSAIRADVTKHLKLDFTHKGTKYNFLQKLAYGVVYGVFLPMMVFTGLAISPGFEPAAPWLVDLLGGRQSARSLHFLFAWALCAFLILHVALVLLTGPIKQVWDMVAGGKVGASDET
ncbi:MAG: cytochrome b/b6 domain-containing protein, partial [Pseudomonadota bacterium]